MEIIETTQSRLGDYSGIQISFEVQSIFEPLLLEKGLGGIQLIEKPVKPYFKDYDLSNHPQTWLQKFDVRNWGFFLALDGENLFGGATVAWNTNGVNMLEDRRDMAVLWDIRVNPAMRKFGVGKSLFNYCKEWARTKGCTQMKIETQNINVGACRFYATMGAELGDINRFAYLADAEAAHEVQLNWYLRL